MPIERCIRCHTILTSEDKHFHGISCHTCEEDSWYAEHFDYLPIHAILRYVRYQLRWLSCIAHHAGSLLLRALRRVMGRKRSEWENGSGR